jgi:iron complex transport system substrate-binding protein
MTMIAIISDVHANLEALEAVLADIDSQKDISAIYCLGELVGYGPDPVGVIDLVEARCAWGLMGNHDYAMLHSPEGFTDIAAGAIQCQRRELAPNAEESRPGSLVDYERTRRWECLRKMKDRTRMLRNTLFVAAVAIALIDVAHSATPTTQARTVRDLPGRDITVPSDVNRLIALGPGALRLVAYLQDVDKIVGIEDMENRMVRLAWLRPYASTLSEAFFERPIVGPGGPGKLPDFERLILARPDVIVTVSVDPNDVRNIETKTGIPTVGLSYGELGSWGWEARESLLILGTLLGKEDRARHVDAYIRWLEADLQRRTSGIPPRARPSAYFGGVSLKGSQGFTSTQAGYTPADMVNARNVADVSGKRGHMLIDKERILHWNPDIIFVDIGSRAILEQDFAKDRQFYRLLKAAQAGCAYSLLPYNNYNTNIEIALLNAYFIGKCLYPNSFADVEMRSKADEIFGELLGVRPDGSLPAYRVLRFPETGPMQWDPAAAADR